MGTSPLSIDVYVAPMRPYTPPDRLGEGEVATWAPSSSTLISGPTEGILIDALLTFDNADQIAAWAKSFGKKITGVYITHGHSDHWLGLAAAGLRGACRCPRAKPRSRRGPCP
jgi:glyoxylase-like metal-dependent hydrolase (beta-lactamase superfamily II)